MVIERDIELAREMVGVDVVGVGVRIERSPLTGRITGEINILLFPPPFTLRPLLAITVEADERRDKEGLPAVLVRTEIGEARAPFPLALERACASQ